jgi:transposase
VTGRDVVWVGVDAGKASHHAAAVDADGRLLWSVKVANGQRQIEELIARAAGSGGQVRWAVDLVSPMAPLLLAVLLTAGQDVVYVPGRMVSSLAGALGGEGKTARSPGC